MDVTEIGIVVIERITTGNVRNPDGGIKKEFEGFHTRKEKTGYKDVISVLWVTRVQPDYRMMNRITSNAVQIIMI